MLVIRQQLFAKTTPSQIVCHVQTALCISSVRSSKMNHFHTHTSYFLMIITAPRLESSIMSTSRSISKQTHRQSDIVSKSNKLNTLSSLDPSNEVSASRNDAFVLDANRMNRGVLPHSAKEDQSGTLSIATLSQHRC